MLDIISFLNPEFAKNMREQEERANQRRLKTAEFVDWNPKIKWTKHLNIKAESYKQYRLFYIKSTDGPAKPNQTESGAFVDSPTGQWRYMHPTIHAGQKLSTWYGSSVGDVMFDGSVTFPAIFERNNYHSDIIYENTPWMSLTPAEIISMRGGTRRAKGRVVVAGLGLGYQLIEVSKRKQVKEIILVERSQELVDWLLPRIKELMAMPVEVIVGDAYKEMPKIKADVGLVDIFTGYGGNDWERDKLRSTCKDIDYIWAWGASTVSGDGW